LPLMGLVTNTDGTLTFFEAVGRPVLGTEVSPDPDAGVPAPIAPDWTLRHVNQGTGVGAGANFFYEDQTGTAIQTPPQGNAGCGVSDGGSPPAGVQLCSVLTGFGD